MRRTLAAVLLAPVLALAACGKEEPPPPPKPMVELTADQKTQLAETRDFGKDDFDGPGLYALLANAHASPRDAFGGAVPPAVVESVDPDSKVKTRVLAVMKEPAAHRGEAVFLEGRCIAKGVDVPGNKDGLLARQDPRWGTGLNYWVVRLGRTEHDPQAMVYFPMSGPALPEPRIGQTVRVAARFYKVFTAASMARDPKNRGVLVETGREEPFAAFIGCAAEVAPVTLFGGELSTGAKIALVIVLIAAGFGGLWFIKAFTRSMSDSRAFKSPADRWQERLDREKEEGYEDDDDMELPEDPAEALKKLGGGKE